LNTEDKTSMNGASEEAAELKTAEDTATQEGAPAADPLAEWKNRTVYLMAEIENMRKRFAREKSDVIRFASEEVIKAVLPVLDNIQLALKATKDADTQQPGAAGKDVVAKILQGVEMTAKHFEQTLERLGVQPVETVGQAFDPSKHEAIAQSENKEHGDGIVSAEMQRGYTLHGRLVRPARVVVNKTAS